MLISSVTVASEVVELVDTRECVPTGPGTAVVVASCFSLQQKCEKSHYLVGVSTRSALWDGLAAYGARVSKIGRSSSAGTL